MKKKFIVLSLFAILILSLMIVFRLSYHYQLEKNVQKQIRKIAVITPWVKISYADLQIEVGGELILSHIVLDNKKSGRIIKINKLYLSEFDQQHEIPYFLHLQAEGIQISVIADQQTKIGLTQLGFTELFASLELNYHYDDLLHRLGLKSTLKIVELAELFFSMELANIDYEQRDYYKINHDEILLLNGQLDFYEKGIFARYIHYQAQELKMSDEQYVKQLQQRVQQKKAHAQVQKHANRILYYQAWQDFFNNKTSLKLQFDQPAGMSIKKIKSLLNTEKGREALSSELNFDIQAQ
jgi:hypothetical protein